MSNASVMRGQHAADERTETVTYTDRSVDPEVEVATAQASRIQYSAYQRRAMGLEGQDVTWRLWDETLDSHTPTEGDLITDSGDTEYTIGTVSTQQYLGTALYHDCLTTEQ